MNKSQIKAAGSKGHTRFAVFNRGGGYHVETFSGQTVPKSFEGELIAQGSFHFDGEDTLFLSARNAVETKALNARKKALRVSLRGNVEIGDEPIYNTFNPDEMAAGAGAGAAAAGAAGAAADANDEPIYNTTEPIRQAAAAAAAEAAADTPITDAQRAKLERAKGLLPTMLRAFDQDKDPEIRSQAHKTLRALHGMIRKSTDQFTEAEFNQFMKLVKAIQQLLPDRRDAN